MSPPEAQLSSAMAPVSSQVEVLPAPSGLSLGCGSVDTPSGFEPGTFSADSEVASVRLPDFSEGFSEAHLPETIPVLAAVKSVLDRSGDSAPVDVLPPAIEARTPTESVVAVKLAASHADGAKHESTLRVPVLLHGLKPGQKVKIHLILEVEAVEE